MYVDDSVISEIFEASAVELNFCWFMLEVEFSVFHFIIWFSGRQIECHCVSWRFAANERHSHIVTERIRHDRKNRFQHLDKLNQHKVHREGRKTFSALWPRSNRCSCLCSMHSFNSYEKSICESQRETKYSLIQQNASNSQMTMNKSQGSLFSVNLSPLRFFVLTFCFTFHWINSHPRYHWSRQHIDKKWLCKFCTVKSDVCSLKKFPFVQSSV